MKKKILIVIAILLLLLGGVFCFIKLFRPGPIIIILSPHFDDAVLSLGGLIAKHESPTIVATFFAGRPTDTLHTTWDKISGFSNSDEAILGRTKENIEALTPLRTLIKNYNYLDFQYRKENQDTEIKKNIAGDIKTLIKTYPDRELFIYGPATFGVTITHPDHQLLHDAFMEVSKTEKNAKIHFFMYEDFPYARQFAMSNLGDLNTYLEKIENLKLTEKPVEISSVGLAEKIADINKYQSQVAAFKSLGDNIGTLAEKFYRERCKTLLPSAYACEIVHLLP